MFSINVLYKYITINIDIFINSVVQFILMPHKERVIRQYAEEILQDLKKSRANNEAPSKHHLTSIINELLTRRDITKNLLDLWKRGFRQYQDDYYWRLKGLKFKKTAHAFDWTMFFHVNCRIKDEDCAQKKTLGLLRVNYKEYFSFHPKAKRFHEVYLEIERFLESLSALHDVLYEFSIANHERVDFKVPWHLFTFLKHPDTLCVYYHNKHLGHQIRVLVERFFRKRDFNLKERIFRATSAFDFKIYEKEEEVEAHSHSCLVAKFLAKHIVEKRRKFVDLSVELMFQWLKNSVKEVNKWNEEEVHRYLLE